MRDSSRDKGIERLEPLYIVVERAKGEQTMMGQRYRSAETASGGSRAMMVWENKGVGEDLYGGHDLPDIRRAVYED